MSKRLIQDLHAGISRRDWSVVEAAANRLRDDIEEATRILSGTGIGSLPNDYPLPRLASDALSDAPELLEALKYARRFLRGLDHDVDYVDGVIAKAEGRS